MENNIKKELFFISLNNFLEKENSIKETKIFTELKKIPYVLYKYIPFINCGINIYNISFNKHLAELEPIINQQSQNCFSIIIQNKNFIYDFDELETQISGLEGKALEEYLCKKANELNLYDFVDDIKYKLDKEWQNAIDNNYCEKTDKDVIDYEL